MKILTTHQVAEQLGVSLTTVYSYIYEDKLKAYKMGGYSKRRHWRIKESDLELFINGDARHFFSDIKLPYRY